MTGVERQAPLPRSPADHRRRTRPRFDNVTEPVVSQAGYEVWLEAPPETLQETVIAEVQRHPSQRGPDISGTPARRAYRPQQRNPGSLFGADRRSSSRRSTQEAPRGPLPFGSNP
jgi:hypothetical protein